MHRPLDELVEEFCTYQRKVGGKTEGGVRAYRWTLQQFLKFVQRTEGRPATVDHLTPAKVRAWMADMATHDLAMATMRVRQSTISSLCLWLVKRDLLSANPVDKLDRPKLTSAGAGRLGGTNNCAASFKPLLVICIDSPPGALILAR